MPVYPSAANAPNVQQGLSGQPVSLMNQTSPQAPMQETTPQAPTEDTTSMIVKALTDWLKNDQKGKLAMGGGMGGGGSMSNYVSHKIPTLMNEGYPQKQSVAIAYSMGKDKGYGGGGQNVCEKCMKQHPGMECEMEESEGGCSKPMGGGMNYQLPTNKIFY